MFSNSSISLSVACKFNWSSFLMPAVFDSLVRSQNLAPHVAWRVAYIVPFILITATALAMLFLCEDTPTGKWADRHLAVSSASVSPPPEYASAGSDVEKNKEEAKAPDLESADSSLVATADSEIVVAPTFRDGLSVIFSPHSIALAVPYAFSFGAPASSSPGLCSLVGYLVPRTDICRR